MLRSRDRRSRSRSRDRRHSLLLLLCLGPVTVGPGPGLVTGGVLAAGTESPGAKATLGEGAGRNSE